MRREQDGVGGEKTGGETKRRLKRAKRKRVGIEKKKKKEGAGIPRWTE